MSAAKDARYLVERLAESELNIAAILAPSWFTATTMARAIKAANNPYSTAVARESSVAKRRTVSPMRILLIIVFRTITTNRETLA
jgi:hypothetical protein